MTRLDRLLDAMQHEGRPQSKLEPERAPKATKHRWTEYARGRCEVVPPRPASRRQGNHLATLIRIVYTFQCLSVVGQRLSAGLVQCSAGMAAAVLPIIGIHD